MSDSNGKCDTEMKKEDNVRTGSWNAESKPLLQTADSWSALLSQANRVDIDQARSIFEQIVDEYPTCALFWQNYVQAELKFRNFERVEALFQRCLMKILNIDLWRCYLNYLQDTKSHLPNYYQIMVQAYEFAVDKVGIDVSSLPVWQLYSAFMLSHAQPQNPNSATVIRNLYMRALSTPFSGLEKIQAEHLRFELSIGTATPRVSPMWFEWAHKVSKQLEQLTRPLARASPCSVPMSRVEELRHNQASALNLDEQKQWALWQKYIEWERTEQPEAQFRHRRVMYAFEQCLLALPHRPDVWANVAVYLIDRWRNKLGTVEDAVELFERAINGYMAGYALIYYMYADVQMERGDVKLASDVYEKLLSVHESKGSDPTLTYINFMKMTCRGAGLEAARHVFCRAIAEEVQCQYHLYSAAAKMEYYWCHQPSKATVITRIFELGMERFSSNTSFILAYVDFLFLINRDDDNNIRVLLERSLDIKRMSESQQDQFAWSEVWLRFLQLELWCGNLNSILSIERRRTDAMAKVRNFSRERYSMALLSDRFRCLGLSPLPQESVGLDPYGIEELERLHTSPVEDRENCLISANDYMVFTSRRYAFNNEPDTSGMLPYVPNKQAPAGSHLLPGGVYPEPKACIELLKSLPPPECFHGPFIIIDKFMEISRNMDLGEDENGKTLMDPDRFKQVQLDRPLLLVQIADGRAITPGALLRSNNNNNNHDHDDEGDDNNLSVDEFHRIHSPPPNDLYSKRRQQKRLRRHFVKSGVRHGAQTEDRKENVQTQIKQ